MTWTPFQRYLTYTAYYCCTVAYCTTHDIIAHLSLKRGVVCVPPINFRASLLIPRPRDLMNNELLRRKKERKKEGKERRERMKLIRKEAQQGRY